MAKIISYDELARQHHINFLEHQCRDYQEREEYLAGLRRLMFQIEGQMRQAEIQQLEVFRRVADHFKVPLEFPSWGDRVAFQEIFAVNPLLRNLSQFFAHRLTVDECYASISSEKDAAPAAED